MNADVNNYVLFVSLQTYIGKVEWRNYDEKKAARFILEQMAGGWRRTMKLLDERGDKVWSWRTPSSFVAFVFVCLLADEIRHTYACLGPHNSSTYSTYTLMI